MTKVNTICHTVRFAQLSYLQTSHVATPAKTCEGKKTTLYVDADNSSSSPLTK